MSGERKMTIQSVTRVREAGLRRLVTISTRVRRFAGVLAIAERFPEVYQVGPPRYRHFFQVLTEWQSRI
jgi:hypothetical protein